MKDKILAHLGEAQAAKVLKAAAVRNLGDDIFLEAAAKASAELPAAKEADLIARAALRLQQRIGVIPKTAPATPQPEAPVPSEGQTIDSRPDDSEPGDQEPGSGLPPVAKTKKAK